MNGWIHPSSAAAKIEVKQKILGLLYGRSFMKPDFLDFSSFNALSSSSCFLSMSSIYAFILVSSFSTSPSVFFNSVPSISTSFIFVGDVFDGELP
jgi:hypothetical protein